MSQINLLPWREKSRQVKNLRFLLMLGNFVILTLFLVLIVHLYFNGLISYQQKRNVYLQSEVSQEEGQLVTLGIEKEDEIAIDKQVNFIISLRNMSFRAVRLLDALAKVVPEGISLNKMVREGNMITLIGKSESNLQVTLFMENIAKSHIFSQPVLSEINTKENLSGEERFFQMKVEQQE